MTNTFDQGSSL